VAASIAEKNELVKQFHAVKELSNYRFVEEENLFELVTQLAENMYEHAVFDENEDYLNYKLLRDIKIP
jgi:hypothetical protein